MDLFAPSYSLAMYVLDTALRDPAVKEEKCYSVGAISSAQDKQEHALNTQERYNFAD
jgi:hypothetical protein